MAEHDDHDQDAELAEWVRAFRAWRRQLAMFILWIDRGNPMRLRVDGHAYRRRYRARMRRSGR